jgi:putative effector of murein hydrolase
MDLNLSEVNIADTFTQLDMMKKCLLPESLTLNSTIKLSGNLDAKEMTPVLILLRNLFRSIIVYNSKNSTLLNALDSKLDLSI